MVAECRICRSYIVNHNQRNVTAINDHLAPMFKIHGNPVANVRLHLPQTPFTLRRVAHQHARFQYSIHHNESPHMTDKPDLMALLGSRICHDLISPIGAIGNGVELLMMGGSAQGPEMALIADSVANASARIRFFRVAFGIASQDQRMARLEIAGIMADLTLGGRITIDWAGPSDVARREAKLLFLLVMCMESALPFGGRIAVAHDDRWVMTATSPKLKIDTGLWDIVLNPTAAHNLTPAQVHFALVPEELRRQERRMTTELSTDAIRLTV
jgi:histidine phosphotransferase ChpT